MKSRHECIENLAWPDIAIQLDQEGYALLPGLLGREEARALARLAQAPAPVAGVSPATGQLDLGDVFYLARPLPEPLAAWHQAFYRHLAPIANRWNEAMGQALRYREGVAERDGYNDRKGVDELERQSGLASQDRGQSSLSRLREGDYQALHQVAEGAQVFPLQLVALLSEPGQDFSGGEFVMTEQRPRMQSRPMVLPLRQGDAAIIALAHRPVQGSNGYYRANLKHAVSRVRGGERIGLEVLFHDAS